MELNTAASVIRYLSNVELQSASLYREWGQVLDTLGDTFLGFAGENRKNEQRVKRAYYNIVSDALETGFCFKGLESSVNIPEFKREAKIEEILESAIKLEEDIRDFYRKASELCRALLADVPRVMHKLADGREERIEKLKTLLEEGKTREVSSSNL